MSAEGSTDSVKGKVKEAVGKVTGNDRLKASGKTDQAKGTAKDAISGDK
ncbi:CsbD family protein [Streptomyces bohaiensis]|uniref:CsbD family protein n=1 Tax=Streptomyces bohaiensis TaxID=1431344 RepID=A0ABX1C3X0_9ACTN|nr:CsbD family protein [Streptomyces bohaiensis]NJQ13919.1 CsbD family protein [Streptomyces bohaiensis]